MNFENIIKFKIAGMIGVLHTVHDELAGVTTPTEEKIVGVDNTTNETSSCQQPQEYAETRERNQGDLIDVKSVTPDSFHTHQEERSIILREYKEYISPMVSEELSNMKEESYGMVSIFHNDSLFHVKYHGIISQDDNLESIIPIINNILSRRSQGNRIILDVSSLSLSPHQLDELDKGLDKNNNLFIISIIKDPQNIDSTYQYDFSPESRVLFPVYMPGKEMAKKFLEHFITTKAKIVVIYETNTDKPLQSLVQCLASYRPHTTKNNKVYLLSMFPELTLSGQHLILPSETSDSESTKKSPGRKRKKLNRLGKKIYQLEKKIEDKILKDENLKKLDEEFVIHSDKLLYNPEARELIESINQFNDKVVELMKNITREEEAKLMEERKVLRGRILDFMQYMKDNREGDTILCNLSIREEWKIKNGNFMEESYTDIQFSADNHTMSILFKTSPSSGQEGFHMNENLKAEIFFWAI